MYKGQLEGFPKEVVEWMLDQQVAQGNKRDITVFEHSVAVDVDGGGFTWHDVPTWKGVDEIDEMDGIDFCIEVITKKNFDLFYKRFPKKTFPRVMLVWYNDEDNAEPRVVIAHKCNKYIAWYEATTIEEAEKEVKTVIWSHAKEVEEKPNIEITVKINGKEAKLSDISEETLKKLREL